MADKNWVKVVSVAPLVLSAALIAIFSAGADAEDAVIHVTEAKGLKVDLKAVPPAAEAPATIRLRGSIRDGTPPFTYTLRFGDGQTREGTTDTGEIVIDHEYVNQGTYTASLSARDAMGRAGTSTSTRGVSSLTTKEPEKPTRRRGWRFWKRDRKTPEKTEEKPEVMTEADKEKAAAEAAAVAAAAEKREKERREALALALEDRIAALVSLQEVERPGRPGVSRIRGEDEEDGPGVRFRRLAPAVKSGLWPKTWELDFEYEPPRRIVVKSDWKSDAGDPYWYMVYRVTNSGDKPMKLSLDVELRTKKDVCSEVYSPRALKAIRTKEKRKLASFMEMTGNLEPAASREAVAVFSDVSNKATDYDFAVSGLNNTYRVGGEEFRMFRRVLIISYERPGDEFQVEYDIRKYKDAVWVEEEFSRK